MTVLSLDQAWQKLRWAKHHYKLLRSDIEAFKEAHDHRIEVETNTETGEYVFYVYDLQSVEDRDWGLLIGDCVHNARAALDYLVVQLIALKTGREPASIDEGQAQFPIYSNPKQFNGATSDLRKELLLPGHLTRIEELQTYNAGDPSIWGVSPPFLSAVGSTDYRPNSLPFALERLGNLDNVDKHRVIHTVWQKPAWYRAVDPPYPAGFTKTSGSTTGDPLHNGAEIGRWRFVTPLPHEWQPHQVEMKAAFPLEVVIGDTPVFLGVLEELAFAIWGAEATLSLFGPVFGPQMEPPFDAFRHVAPPLPVTSVQPPTADFLQ